VSLVSSMYWLGYYSPQQPKEPLEKSVKNVVSCGAPDPQVPVGGPPPPLGRAGPPPDRVSLPPQVAV
jgi:hypothetical protein